MSSRVGRRSDIKHSLHYNLTCENGKQEAMNVIAETTLIWTHVTLETVVGDRSHAR